MRTRILMVSMAALTLVVAACGARLSDEQLAEVEARGSGAVAIGNVSTGPTTSIVGGTEGTEGTEGTTGSGGGTTGGGTGGSGGSDGGGGQSTGGGGGGEGSSCAGGGATETGVTEGEIRIGNVSTITGPIQGFGQTGQNAVKAYFAMVNATGGVCGRELVLISEDDRLQSGTNKAKTDELSQEVLGFVGGVSVVDDGSAQSLEGTNIADSSLGLSDLKLRSPNNFSPTPFNPNVPGNNAQPIFEYFKAERGVQTTAVVYPKQATARARMEDYKADLAAVGIAVVSDSGVEVTQTDYSGVAQNIAAAEADMVVTTLEITGMANLARAMQQNEYVPAVPFYGAQAYGDDFIALAGAEAAEPTVLGLAFSILEDAGSNAGVQELITWYSNVNPGSNIDFFAIQSWAAADLYVDALRTIDGEITRDRVFAALENTTSFDANGILAEVNPGGKRGAQCFMIAEVSGGAWSRAHPASGFDCSYG